MKFAHYSQFEDELQREGERWEDALDTGAIDEIPQNLMWDLRTAPMCFDFQAPGYVWKEVDLEDFDLPF